MPGYGAMPPPGLEWMMGKTVMTMDFVRTAEGILAQSKLSSETAQRLRDWVERVKDGKDLITEPLTEQQIVTRCI